MTRGNASGLLNVLAWLLIVFGIATAAGAQETPQQCAAIASDGERLACYDALFRDVVPTADVASVEIESAQLIPAQPTGRRPASMVVSCEAGQAVVTFAFAGQFVSNTGDIASMTYQVDSSATLVRTMSANAANTELTFGSARDTTTFLDGLVGARNVKVRMTPVRQRSLTVDFRTGEVIDEIEAVRAGCGG